MSQRSADAHDRSGGVYDVREGYIFTNQLPGSWFVIASFFALGWFRMLF